MLGVSRTSAPTTVQPRHRLRIASKYAATRSGRRQVGWLQWLASFQVTYWRTHGYRARKALKARAKRATEGRTVARRSERERPKETSTLARASRAAAM